MEISIYDHDILCAMLFYLYNNVFLPSDSLDSDTEWNLDDENLSNISQ